MKIFAPDGSAIVYALFNEGFQSTMMDDKLAKELNIGGEIKPVTYKWTGKVIKHYPNSKRIKSLQLAVPSRIARFITYETFEPWILDCDVIVLIWTKFSSSF